MLALPRRRRPSSRTAAPGIPTGGSVPTMPTSSTISATSDAAHCRVSMPVGMRESSSPGGL